MGRANFRKWLGQVWWYRPALEIQKQAYHRSKARKLGQPGLHRKTLTLKNKQVIGEMAQQLRELLFALLEDLGLVPSTSKAANK